MNALESKLMQIRYILQAFKKKKKPTQIQYQIIDLAFLKRELCFRSIIFMYIISAIMLANENVFKCYIFIMKYEILYLF